MEEEELIHHVASMSKVVTELFKYMKNDSKHNNMEQAERRVTNIVSEDMRDI